jgi:hypothetical protein
MPCHGVFLRLSLIFEIKFSIIRNKLNIEDRGQKAEGGKQKTESRMEKAGTRKPFDLLFTIDDFFVP